MGGIIPCRVEVTNAVFVTEVVSVTVKVVGAISVTLEVRMFVWVVVVATFLSSKTRFEASNVDISTRTIIKIAKDEDTIIPFVLDNLSSLYLLS